MYVWVGLPVAEVQAPECEATTQTAALLILARAWQVRSRPARVLAATATLFMLNPAPTTICARPAAEAPGPAAVPERPQFACGMIPCVCSHHMVCRATRYQYSAIAALWSCTGRITTLPARHYRQRDSCATIARIGPRQRFNCRATPYQ